MWRSRTFWRLFGSFAVLLLAAIGLLGLVIVQRVEWYHLRLTDERLHTKAQLLRALVEANAAQPPEALQKTIHELGTSIQTRLTLLADNGDVVADSAEDPRQMENHSKRPEVLDARAHGYGTASRRSDTVHDSMRYAALYVGAPGQRIAYVRVALSLDHINDELATLRGLVWTAAGVTALAALALAFWLTRRITRPLQELTAGVERVAKGGYGHKVYAGGRDEIGALSRTFNHMSEALAAQFAQMDEDRQQLRAILSGMVEGVIALDAGQRILFVNDRAVQLLDLKSQPVIGRKLWEVFRQRGLQQLVRRALGSVENCREELLLNGQAVKHLTVHAAPLEAAGFGVAGGSGGLPSGVPHGSPSSGGVSGGSPSGVPHGSPPSGRGAVLVLHDTSELRRLERVRQEFVANVSHELKTPLSVIQACVETLIDGAADDPDHRGPFLEQILDQSNRLHSLILDLLSLARIESGTEAFTFQAVSLAQVVDECLERHHARAESKNQALEAVPPPADDAPTVAWADEEAVGQIVDNLVDNALKYTPAGGRIRVRWQAEGKRVVLEVEDTGIGIPERDLPRIFERFYRVDKARSRALGGTGLGLSIVKHLVQAMHGTVGATSQLGQGTTFQVKLPRAGA